MDRLRYQRNNSLFTIYDLGGNVLIEAPLVDGQWVEVNYFSTWNYRFAREKYSDGDMTAYLNLVPSVIRQALLCVDGFQLRK